MYDFVRVICGSHFSPVPSLHMEYTSMPYSMRMVEALLAREHYESGSNPAKRQRTS